MPLKPRTGTVVIYDGDDLDHLSRLDAAVERTSRAVREAQQAVRAKLAIPASMDETDTPEGRLLLAQQARDEAEAARDVFAAGAEGRGVTVVMHARPRRVWRSLMRDHGPRDDVEEDEAFGVNMETMPEALLPMSIDPDASTIDGDIAEFLESLSDYDYYDRLFVTAFALNRGSAVADPTQRLLSHSSQTSDETSS